MMNLEDEKRIVDKARSGDDKAYALLVSRYAGQTFAFVRRITGSREEAEEAVQDTFVKAWRNLRKFDGRSSFSTWLWRIACNTALSAARRSTAQRKNMISTPEPLREDIPDGEVDAFFADEADDGRIAALNRAIDALAPDDKALVMLYYFEQKSVAECARIAGIKENNAKVQLHRIRKRLCAMIKNSSDER